MSSTTPNLNLFKYDVDADGKAVFSIQDALNNNWDKIDTNCSNKVSKSGDTMTGNLKLKGAALRVVDVQNTSTSITETPDSDVNIGAFRILDADGTICGQIYVTAYTNGATQTRIYIRNNKNGSATGTSIDLGLDKNGNPYTWCPACDSNNSILTTVSLTKGQTGYLKLGNGIILQWGYIEADSTRYDTGRTINLNVSYSLATSYQLVLGQHCPNSSGSMDFNDFSIASKTTTQFSIRMENTTFQQGISWFTIGY